MNNDLYNYENEENNNSSSKKTKYNINDIVYVNGLECKIIFGPFEKGFFSFYEIEDSNGKVYPVNSKDIKKKV